MYAHGIKTFSDLFNKNTHFLKSFQDLFDEYHLPRSNFFKYLQTRHEMSTFFNNKLRAQLNDVESRLIKETELNGK